MIKCVFFDFWNTLITFDGEEVVEKMRQERANKFKEELTHHGYNFSQKKVWETLESMYSRCTKIRDTTHKELGDQEVTSLILKELGIESNEISLKLAEELAEIYSNALLSMKLRLQTGASEVLEWLKENHFKTGILSNTSHGTTENILLEKFNIRQYFDSITFSCDVGVRKPATEIFNYALNSLSVRPDEAVHIGDTPEADILGAKQSGMKAIYLNTKNKPYPEELSQPDFTVQELAQIPNVLSGMTERIKEIST